MSRPGWALHKQFHHVHTLKLGRHEREKSLCSTPRLLAASWYAKSECQELVHYGSVAEREREVKGGEERHSEYMFRLVVNYADRNITHDTFPIHKHSVCVSSKEN